MGLRGLEEKKDPFIRKIREVQPWDWDHVSHLYLGRTLLSISFPQGWKGLRKDSRKRNEGNVWTSMKAYL